MAFIHIMTVLAMSSLIKADQYGYSFAKFSGPVSGPAREVVTHNDHHGHSVDYVAKPDYQFEYGIEDPKSHVSQFRKENRHDDAVVGEYSYTDPLGHVRTVKYTADKLHGFRADIYVDGKLETPHPPQAPVQNHHSHQNNHVDDEEEENDDDHGGYSTHDDISEGYEDSGEYTSSEY